MSVYSNFLQKSFFLFTGKFKVLGHIGLGKERRPRSGPKVIEKFNAQSAEHDFFPVHEC